MADIEIWKDIDGYEGVYEVSSFGRVRSLKFGKERILKPFKNSDGYLLVKLYKNNIRKGFLVHRLVAQTFIDNPQNFDRVNHKDENKENNCAENLEWCDSKYNSNYGLRNEKVSEALGKAVYMLDKETGQTLSIFRSTREAERITKINRAHISSCCSGKRKSAGGYKWEYLPV